MRHRVYGKKLGRDRNQRAGLFRSLVQSLFTYGTITTSQTKASAIKGMVDKIITAAKNKDSKRILQSFFADKLLQERLIKEIAPKLQNRVSGYTSMVKIGVREGDRTTLVKMSLIGLEELKPLQKEPKEKKAKEPTEKVATKKTNKSLPEDKGQAERTKSTRTTKRVASKSSK